MSALTEEDLRKLIHESVRETLISLGIGASDPLDMQADFLYLREWRLSMAKAKTRGMVVIVGFIVSGFLAALWLGLRTMLRA